VWFRMATRIKLDDWSGDTSWQARCVRPERWLSTNHLVGAGYWVWLIPLPGGAHSVGIVADAKLHPLREINSFERALAWLQRHQPQVADAVSAERATLMDFVALKNYSYGCKRVFSAQRWALTGEAGLFLDPFYSPGTDFIAIANTYITDLIVRERSGESVAMLGALYERLYLSFYESTLDLYLHQSRIFGNAEVMPIKVLWDYAYYWGVLAQIYFQRRLTDLSALSALKPEFMSLQAVNREVQRLLREWADATTGANPPQLLDQAALPWFAELNRALGDTLDRAGFIERLQENHALLMSLAAEILARARAQSPELHCEALEKLLQSPARAQLLFPAA
jgi:hypothetical protein